MEGAAISSMNLKSFFPLLGSKKRKTALVLSGGAARGLAHLGFLKVLKEQNLTVDFIVGTSIGSLMGAVFAGGLDIEKAHQLAKTFTWKDFIDLTYKGLGLFPGKKLQQTILKVVGDLKFSDLKIPLIVTTTDLETGELVKLQTGSIAEAVRASCAIPGIFSPIEIEGRLLFDGGVLENLPVKIAKQQGADTIIAVDVGYSFKKKRPQNIIEVIYKAFLLKGEALSQYHREEADVLICPELPEVDQMDFHKAEECIRGGILSAQEALPKLERVLRKEKR